MATAWQSRILQISRIVSNTTTHATYPRKDPLKDYSSKAVPKAKLSWPTSNSSVDGLNPVAISSFFPGNISEFCIRRFFSADLTFLPCRTRGYFFSIGCGMQFSSWRSGSICTIAVPKFLQTTNITHESHPGRTGEQNSTHDWAWKINYRQSSPIRSHTTKVMMPSLLST